MYSSRQSYGSHPPELSNNPFIDHPSNALTRYPDINGTDNPEGTSTQFTSWLQASGQSAATSPGGYFGPGQQLGSNAGYQPQQQTGWPGNTGYPQQPGYNTGYSSPVQTQPSGMPFQPSSSFGQQLAGHLNSQYGTPAPQQQASYTSYHTSPQQATPYGYPQQQQQQPQQNAYVPEFDPYTSQGAVAPQTASQFKPQHPREFIQQHKAELESWDAYAWKQVSRLERDYG